MARQPARRPEKEFLQDVEKNHLKIANLWHTQWQTYPNGWEPRNAIAVSRYRLDDAAGTGVLSSSVSLIMLDSLGTSGI